MLKGFYIAFALALLVATTAFAWGQTSQQPQPQAQQAQNQPTSDQRGTEQAPFIVKAAPKSEAEAAADAKEREEKSRLDRQLVKYTLYLAIIALLQFGALIAQAVFVAGQSSMVAASSEHMFPAEGPFSKFGVSMRRPASRHPK
jgi:hypothetical protein